MQEQHPHSTPVKSGIRFSVSNVRLCQVPPSVAFFDLRLAGVLLVDCKLVRGRNRDLEKVVGPSCRDIHMPNGWRSYAVLEPQLAAEVLAEVQAQLRAVNPPTNNSVDGAP